MANSRLTTQDAAQAIKALKAAGGVAARRLKIPINTFKSRIDAAVGRFGFERPEPSRIERVKLIEPTTPQISLPPRQICPSRSSAYSDGRRSDGSVGAHSLAVSGGQGIIDRLWSALTGDKMLSMPPGPALSGVLEKALKMLIAAAPINQKRVKT